MNSYIYKAVLLLHMTVVPPGMRNSDYYLEIMALFVVAIFSLTKNPFSLSASGTYSLAHKSIWAPWKNTQRPAMNASQIFRRTEENRSFAAYLYASTNSFCLLPAPIGNVNIAMDLKGWFIFNQTFDNDVWKLCQKPQQLKVFFFCCRPIIARGYMPAHSKWSTTTWNLIFWKQHSCLPFSASLDGCVK